MEMSDRTANWSEIWDSLVVVVLVVVLVVHVWCTFGLVKFTVILGSFGVLTIFRNLT